MTSYRLNLFFILLLGFPTFLWAQTGVFTFKVKSMDNKELENTNIRLYALAKSDSFQVLTNAQGLAEITLPTGKYKVVVSMLNFTKEEILIQVNPADKQIRYITLKQEDIKVEGINIENKTDPTDTQNTNELTFVTFPTKKLEVMPNFKTDIESRLQMLGGGVSSNNEFSSQYRVRGGNFDENLIYVNDIEIYRPQLTRSGQQEGLGFTNSFLVDNIMFSSGGFDNRYGDKMSSVLNIQYKNPNKFKANAELGLISQNLSFEGSSKNKEDSTEAGRFTYLVGVRRFAISYLLNSLQTKGDYKPQFFDAQGLFSYKPKGKGLTIKVRERKDGTQDTIYLPKDKWEISTLLHTSQNNYRFFPTERETTFGLYQQAFKLFVAFEGKEETGFTTGLGALKIEHRPSFRLNLKYIAEVYRSVEYELADVEGGYRLADINTDYSSDQFNEVIFVRGVGTYYNHSRNYFTGTIISAEHKGQWFLSKEAKNKLQWGLKWKKEIIRDELKEWKAIDSADYVSIDDLIMSKNAFQSDKLESYVQTQIKIFSIGQITVGTRASYWTLNQQFILNPRFQFVIDPKLGLNPKNQEYQFRLAIGSYQQPAFYREMRDHEGYVNKKLLAQQSYHFILGGDYGFRVGGRRFKVYTEAYYKKLDRLDPYEIDNVRIRYFGKNLAKGYAYGLDFRINGKFLRDLDSWLSISYLNTKEDLSNDNRGMIRRPSDQRLAISFFFQDQLPMNPTIKAHINYVFGTGYPFGPPQNIANRNIFTMPSYHRVDLGISKVFLIDTQKKLVPKNIWLSLEVFNLFARANTVSYLWLKDVYGTQFAVPNYLSARLLNLRIIANI